MKNKLIYLAVISLSISVLWAAPSEINYQGVLTDQQGNPVNGVRSMQIKLYDAPTGGNMTYQQNIGNQRGRALIIDIFRKPIRDLTLNF